ncbi:MAG: hypothetical protein LC754_11285 [Acidobacteria bacterium]|nr:hypothetical protein [Acidobacteriota bacterium]
MAVKFLLFTSVFRPHPSSFAFRRVDKGEARLLGSFINLSDWSETFFD